MKPAAKAYRTWGLLILAAVLFFAVQSRLQDEIHRVKAAERLTLTPPWVAQTPGQFAGTILLGGFRGLAVDLLWIRSEGLKNEGKFYELLALTDVLCNLQPNYPSVWSMLSWNMAYNLSYSSENSKERRAWVDSGVATLKKGIALNPESSKLYFELAMIYEGRLFYDKEMADEFRKEGIDREQEAHKWLVKAYEQKDCPYAYTVIVPFSYAKVGEVEKGREVFAEMKKRFPEMSEKIDELVDIYDKQNK